MPAFVCQQETACSILCKSLSGQSARDTRASAAHSYRRTGRSPAVHLFQAQALNEQKSELLSKVHTLKKELGDWRSKLDVQVKTYRNVSTTNEWVQVRATEGARTEERSGGRAGQDVQKGEPTLPAYAHSMRVLRFKHFFAWSLYHTRQHSVPGGPRSLMADAMCISIFA